MKKIENELAIIEEYQKCRSCRIVAENLKCSDETVRRVLIRNNIPRVMPKPERIKPLRQKATEEELRQIVDEYYSSDATLSYLSKKYHRSPLTISKAIKKYGHGLDELKSSFNKVFTDAQLIELIKKGLHRQEIAAEFGVNVVTVDKRMKKLGIYAEPLPNKGNPASLKISVTYGVCWHYVKSHDEKVKSQTDDFIYVESRSDIKKMRLKCRHCGKIVEKLNSAVRRGSFKCGYCRQEDKRQKELMQKRIELMRVFYALTEYKKNKFCATCGNEFHSLSIFAKYCSAKCKKHEHSYRSRAKKYGVYYESGITRIKVVKRDKYICQICGKKCDPNDFSWGSLGPDFPTLDHVIPLAKGGSHTWDNVQCACGICNSNKRDLLIV